MFSSLQANHSIDFDTGSALVLTIESTLITACSSESLVSKGHFKNFCIRFAEGFETTWDDWKPEIRGDLVMNACERQNIYLCHKFACIAFLLTLKKSSKALNSLIPKIRP